MFKIELAWNQLPDPIDLDLSAFICHIYDAKHSVSDDSDIICYANPVGRNNSILHLGDNRTGAAVDGISGKEIIECDMDGVSQSYTGTDEVMFFVSVFQGNEEGDPLEESQMTHTIGQTDAVITVTQDDVVICSTNISDVGDKLSAQLGVLTFSDGKWTFELHSIGYMKNFPSVVNRLRFGK